MTSCFKSVNDRTILWQRAATLSSYELAAALNFDTFTEDLAVLSSLLNFVTL